MDLTHTFTVPTSVDETWAHFQDIASVAECFPGATVTSAEGDSFAGSVKVKLGPIALVYNGSGTFVEKDEAAHRFVVDAKGKDKRGNGTAGAKVTLTMTPADGGATDVEVITDLAITGKPAQFGRGVMQDVSDKLLGQFVACLEQRLSRAGRRGSHGRSGCRIGRRATRTSVTTPTVGTRTRTPHPAPTGRRRAQPGIGRAAGAGEDLLEAGRRRPGRRRGDRVVGQSVLGVGSGTASGSATSSGSRTPLTPGGSWGSRRATASTPRSRQPATRVPM